MRTTDSSRRPYRMRRRAELVEATRLRITEAAARLHTTIGPAATTIAAIADAAGVTRLTVYRHFRDVDELFVACQAHWIGRNPPPDPRAWLEVPDLRSRARTALRELYAWYRLHADELFPIYRDLRAMPPAAQDRLRAREAARADAVAGDVAASPAGRRRRAAAGHVTEYWTWRSLAIEQGLGDDEIVDLAIAFLVAAEPAAEPVAEAPDRPSSVTPA